PLTQQLSDEPVLKENRAWLGPVKVPDHQAGWTQTTQKNIAGLSYKQQVEGFLPGVDQSSYTNLSNLDSHKFCIVGKLRTNGILLVIGNDISGLDFTGDTTSGMGSKDTAGTKILFTGETMDKAVILPAMFVDDSSPFIIDGD